jgi:hypothetical protein
MLQHLKEKVPFMDGRDKLAGISSYNSKTLLAPTLNYNSK